MSGVVSPGSASPGGQRLGREKRRRVSRPSPLPATRRCVECRGGTQPASPISERLAAAVPPRTRMADSPDGRTGCPADSAGYRSQSVEQVGREIAPQFKCGRSLVFGRAGLDRRYHHECARSLMWGASPIPARPWLARRRRTRWLIGWSLPRYRRGLSARRGKLSGVRRGETSSAG